MEEKQKNKRMRGGISLRLVILFITLVILPFILGAALLAALFQNYMLSSVGKTAADAVASIGSQINGAVREYEEDSMALYYNGYVEFLENPGSVTREQKQKIQEALVSSCFSDTSVHAIYLVTPKEVYHGGAHYNTLLQLMEPYREEIVEAGGAVRWYYTNQLQGNAKENKYILARSLNSQKKENVGILYMVIDDKPIKNAFHQLEYENYKMYLTTKEGEILFSPDGREFGETLDVSPILPHLLYGSEKVDFDGKRQIMVYRHLMAADWYCISIISEREILLDILKLEYPLLLVAVIYIACLIWMLYLMKKYVFGPLSILKKNMDEYACGDLKAADMQEVGVGEFRSLSRHFNHMTERIAGLLEDYRRETDEKNRQKIKALTSQLTPHFIYNALNTIKWMAVLNHQANIQHLTESLIHIFMNAAKADDGNYRLSDELELVTNYAVIQKARFMNFDLSLDIQEGAEKCRIRKFLLQPVVENAIVHGLGRGRIKNTEIRIKAWIDENLYLTVEDQGMGFDVEEWRRNPDTEESHTNIGLHNIEEIIRLEYGSPYGLEIESQKGAGTKIRYILPAVREGEAYDTAHHRR